MRSGGVVIEMADTSLFERYRFWGWVVTDVVVIAFFVVLGLSMVFGVGINGISTLPSISLVLVGLAVFFIVGLGFEIYGSVRIWLSRRRSTPEAPVGRSAKRARTSGDTRNPFRGLVNRLRG